MTRQIQLFAGLVLLIAPIGCVSPPGTTPRAFVPRVVNRDLGDVVHGTREDPVSGDPQRPVDEQQVPGSDWPSPVHDNQPFTFLRAEQLELRVRDGAPNISRWDVQGWYGRDFEKLWVKLEGEQSVEGKSEGEAELQALFSQLVAPFWDFQIGARYDREWGPGPATDRWFGVIGLQGFSPYEFETELALFVSEDADISARLTATTDFLLTQRLIMQPRIETEAALEEVPKFEVGQGLNYVELGLRWRYEFVREFAPYFGINWIRNLGETEDLIRRGGGEASELSLVLGLSVWF